MLTRSSGLTLAEVGQWVHCIIHTFYIRSLRHDLGFCDTPIWNRIQCPGLTASRIQVQYCWVYHYLLPGFTILSPAFLSANGSPAGIEMKAVRPYKQPRKCEAQKCAFTWMLLLLLSHFSPGESSFLPFLTKWKITNKKGAEESLSRCKHFLKSRALLLRCFQHILEGQLLGASWLLQSSARSLLGLGKLIHNKIVNKHMKLHVWLSHSAAPEIL